MRKTHLHRRGARAGVLAVVSILTLVGCTFDSTQVDMVKGAAGSARRALAAADETQPDPRFAWLLRFNDLETIVYAVAVPDGIVFVNGEGVRIAFDGWDVVGGDGLPQAIGRFRVEKHENGRRVYDIGGAGVFEVICDEPKAIDNDWRTDCVWEEGPESSDVIVRMTHWLMNDADGQIDRLEAQIVPGADPLVLERQRVRE